VAGEPARPEGFDRERSALMAAHTSAALPVDPSSTHWDAIVIGSGSGGLASAAALAKLNRRVLVLERQHAFGGSTNSFSRNGFTWDVGLHYLSEAGAGLDAVGTLDWLCDGPVEVFQYGDTYDVVHLPGGFEFGFMRPEAGLQQRLKELFPDSAAQLDAYFGTLKAAANAFTASFILRGLPAALRPFYAAVHRRAIDRWCGISVHEMLERMIGDPRLRAVLGAQWCDYGAIPSQACFGMQAKVTRSFSRGAFYPVGGAAVISQRMLAVIERAGGRAVADAHVDEILVERGAVQGVRTADGRIYRASRVISGIGVLNTVGKLLPAELREAPWAKEILSFAPSHSAVVMHLGFEGDIAAHGATVHNHWFFETWDQDANLWEDPFAPGEAPMMFASFASLHDPKHDPGPRRRHSGDLIVMTKADAFTKWIGPRDAAAEAEYQQKKAELEEKLLAQFARYFPQLAPLLVYHQLSTPATVSAYTGAPRGAIYGIEVTPRRFLSPHIGPYTGIRGLYLGGQDVVTPGVFPAIVGGVMAAGAIDPRALFHLPFRVALGLS
jgi:all-trans-retinol 13,14-reductase